MSYLGEESQARFVTNMTDVWLHRLLLLNHHVPEEWDKSNPYAYWLLKYNFGAGIQLFETVE